MGLLLWFLICRVGLNEEFLKIVRDTASYDLRYGSKSKLVRELNLALYWLEQSTLATDLVMKVLFDMFTLETLLGDKGEGLKARRIAFNRALLSTIVNDHYPDPYQIPKLYKEVRSNAVHGGEIDAISKTEASSLSHTARAALSEYIQVVKSQKFTRPNQMLDYLNNHEKHDELLEWLTKFDNGWAQVRDTPNSSIK